ncbi:FIST N-terminal domain-containing protein [Roseovarius aestuarii]|uniref:FIST N domain protein n=1 Tax=Roseovarius aestuarii TaxID=475083 RepID=A0A1X7BWA7_9RHOB|nr:FIST N-terminal domain-containing protein [Roseovarius aestuarii]SMC13942.1 FIST N domain protein [Roseovarius aestuarii]
MNRHPEEMDGSVRIISVGVSRNDGAIGAVDEAVQQLGTWGHCFVLAFLPESLDHTAVAEALNEKLPGTPVFGCTSGGQITPQGYEDEALLLIGFPRTHFRCTSTLICPLKPVSIQETALQAKTLATRFRSTANWRHFALTFADGLSKQEDVLVAALDAGLGDIPVFGGSAGRGLSYDVTYILHDGAFHENAALLLLVETNLQLETVRFDHFTATDTQLVVTSANPEDRIVHEINGSPAAEEYARLTGYSIDELSPTVFAENPVLVRAMQSYHVRAIQEVLEDGSMTFLSAIENGLILALGRGKEIIETMQGELRACHRNGEEPGFVLGFDCVLRRLEIEQKSLRDAASSVLRQNRVVGFNTYGEQFGGIHMNQTFVGIAFYPPEREFDL